MTVRLLLVLLSATLAIPFLPAQAPPPPNPDAQAINEAIEGLKKAHKEKIDADQIMFIKLLSEKWASTDDKQRKEIHDLAERTLKARNQDVKDAAVEALSKMGGGEKDKDAETSTKILIDERGKKPTEDNLGYFSQIVLAIGKLHHPKGAPMLQKLLHYKDYEIVAAAAEALGHYQSLPMDLKRDIVEDLLKQYTSIWNQVKNEPRNPTLVKRLDQVNGPMEESLKKLTNKTDASGADVWWKWWNDTGKKAKTW